jgi:hypothetical protein
LADVAKQFWDQGILMRQIAELLDCNHNTATAAIEYWFTSRGLPVLDGRHRRKLLGRAPVGNSSSDFVEPGETDPLL